MKVKMQAAPTPSHASAVNGEHPRGGAPIPPRSPAEYWLSRNRHAINHEQSHSRSEGYQSSLGLAVVTGRRLHEV